MRFPHGLKGRIDSIQVLRAIAAYLIVVVHLGALFQHLGLDPIFKLAAGGVDIFFVISGFIMVYTTSSTPQTGPGHFLRHRLARVVPSYWLLTCAVFVIGRFGHVPLSGTQTTGTNLLKSLFFLPYARLDGRMEPLLFVGWSLNYEMMFYLAFALAMVGRGRIRHLRWLAMAMVALVASRALPIDLPREWHFYRSPVLLDFVYGMVLARYYPLIPVGRGWCYLAAVMLGVALAGMVCLQLVLTGMASSLGGGLLAAVVVGTALQIELCGSWPQWSFGLKMGNASYALYLTHPFVVSAMLLAARDFKVFDIGSLTILSFVTLGLSTGVALVYYRNIENPLTRLALGRGLRRRQVPMVKDPVPVAPPHG